MNTVAARFAAERRFYVGAAIGILALLAGCTDLVAIAADPVRDDSVLLAAEGHGLAAAQAYEFQRALALAAHRER